VPAKRLPGQVFFTPGQIEQTSIIARARIHVERAFARVKQFRFFRSEISISQADMLGKVFYVACMLTHHMIPLVDDKRKGKNTAKRHHSHSHRCKQKQKHKQKQNETETENAVAVEI
jgi:hypothetical protein